MTQQRHDMQSGLPNVAKPNETADYLRAHDTAPIGEDVRDKAQQVAGDVQEKAQQVAGDVQEKAAQLGTQATEQINSAMSTAGQKLTDLAQTVREKSPDAKIGELAASTAGALEKSGAYLESADLDVVRGDLENLIRRHPVEALFVGLGVGFLLARSMRR